MREDATGHGGENTVDFTHTIATTSLENMLWDSIESFANECYM